MSLQTKEFYEFANFRLDPSEKILLNDGKPVPLTPKVFDTLLILLENAGRLLEKDELMRKIWQDRFVEESNLTFNIKMLRKALGDAANNPQFIETVHRRGYRFIAEVKEFQENASSIAQNEKADLLSPSRRPYFLITISIISLISLFSIAFVWLSRDKSFAPKQLNFARLTNTGKVTNVTVSPDGKSIVFAQREGVGESLWVRQIDTGIQNQILPPEDVKFVGLAVSPDNSSAYYSVFSKNIAVSNLARISLQGGTPEHLPEIATDASVSFSPDGQTIAYHFMDYGGKNPHWKLGLINSENHRLLNKLEFPVPITERKTVWHPNNSFLTMIFYNGENVGILLLSATDGKYQTIANIGVGKISSFAWSPDGSRFAFSQKFETNDVISMPVPAPSRRWIIELTMNDGFSDIIYYSEEFLTKSKCC